MVTQVVSDNMIYAREAQTRKELNFSEIGWRRVDIRYILYHSVQAFNMTRELYMYNQL